MQSGEFFLSLDQIGYWFAAENSSRRGTSHVITRLTYGRLILRSNQNSTVDQYKIMQNRITKPTAFPIPRFTNFPPSPRFTNFPSSPRFTNFSPSPRFTNFLPVRVLQIFSVRVLQIFSVRVLQIQSSPRFIQSSPVRVLQYAINIRTSDAY